MKYIPIILAVILFACNPKEKKPGTVIVTPVDTIPPVVKVDTSIHLPDVVLENPEMDRRAKEELQLRRFPKKPRPGEPPPPPPPPPAGESYACVMLDFDGHLVSGTMWNTNGDINCGPSGLSATQTATVLNNIRNYFSFDDSTVVTMDETIYHAYPQNKRRRVVFTVTNPFGNTMGGIAYINSLNWFDETPCFVFTNLLGYNVKNISDAGAHEAGHTFGCRHHADWRTGSDGVCIKYSDYLWGPDIMGASYNDPAPYFGVGPNSLCCTCIQDAKWIIENTRRL